MKLYIMNMTNRDHELTWRWKTGKDMNGADNYDKSPRRQTLRAGQQDVIIGDLSERAIADIIEQNEKYGLRAAKDLVREKGFIGLAYAIDETVSFDQIGSQIERNDIEVAADGDLRREATAHAIQDHVSRETGKEVKRVEIEQVETGTINAPDAKRDNPTVAVGAEFVGDGVAPRHRGKTRANA